MIFFELPIPRTATFHNYTDLVKAVFVFLFIILCTTEPTTAATWYVTTNGTGTGSGDWSNATNCIQTAVAIADPGGTVLVSNGVYNVTSDIKIDKELHVRSWNAGVEDRAGTIIAGDGNCAGLYLQYSNAFVSGFTITNGGGSGGWNNNFGGGVTIRGGTLSNCVVIGNNASWYGGGIHLENEFSLVTDCEITGNTTDDASKGAGGVMIRFGAKLLNSRILDNVSTGTEGGGVFADRNTIVSNCFIAGNKTLSQSGAGGGGIFVKGTNVLVIDCVLSNNYAGFGGGGIYVSAGNYVTVLNSSITHNRARVIGGGFSAWRTSEAGGATISNSVISYNQTLVNHARGGGIADGWNIMPTSEGNLSVFNSKIIGNMDGGTGGTQGGGVWVYTHGTATFKNCEIVGNKLTQPYSSGAGMYIGTGSFQVVLQNTLIADNRIEASSYDGGGIFFGASESGANPLDVLLKSCTIINNQTKRDYGGMNMVPGHVKVWNTIVSFNQADRDYDNLREDADYIAPFYYSCSPNLTNATQGNITNSPVFADFVSGNYRLLAGSPGINAGTNQLSWMTNAVDLDGYSRIDRFSGIVDMGCYEYVPKGTMYRLK